MYYRPREKKSKFLRWLLLLAFTLILLALLTVYVGYVEFEPPVLAQQFQPTPTPTRPAVLYISDGDNYFTEGKLREAIEAYEQAIQIDPDNDTPYIRQSRLLVYTRETAKAVDRAAKAVRLNPTSPENLAYYCRALDWEARYEEAFDACSCAIELDPDYAPGYAFLSEVYADQGNWRLARETAEQAIETDFQSVDAHHNMGYALEVQGRYREGLEYYENAVTLAPNLAPLYIDAGQGHYSLADYETAADYFKRAIKLAPTDPIAYNWLGWTHYVDGDHPRAIDALEQSVGVDPTHVNRYRGTSAWGNLGIVYYTRQNFEKAIELLPKAIDLAEGQFVRHARQIEVYTRLETFTGPESFPVLRGQFIEPTNYRSMKETARLTPVVYKSSVEVDPEEQSCAEPIVRSIKNEEILVGPTQALTTTLAFSQTTGAAALDFNTGLLSLDLHDLPPSDTPYEIKVAFWPNRTDSIGFVQPDGQGDVRVNIQFEEKSQAPIEYYYTLGLAYVYLNPPNCDRAIPWLLKSLEMDGSGGNPAWAGLRPGRCPTSNSPPTPIPTVTPTPEASE